MARFRGTVSGGGKSVSRVGRVVQATAAGWDVGVEVNGYDRNGADAIEIKADGGSNGARGSVPIATVMITEGQIEIRDDRPPASVPVYIVESDAMAAHNGSSFFGAYRTLEEAEQAKHDHVTEDAVEADGVSILTVHI